MKVSLVEQVVLKLKEDQDGDFYVISICQPSDDTVQALDNVLSKLKAITHTTTTHKWTEELPPERDVAEKDPYREFQAAACTVNLLFPNLCTAVNVCW